MANNERDTAREAMIDKAKTWLETNTQIRWATEAVGVEKDYSLEELNRRPQKMAERLATFALEQIEKGWEANAGWVPIKSENDLPKESGDYWWSVRSLGNVIDGYFHADWGLNIQSGDQYVKYYSAWMKNDKPEAYQEAKQNV